MNRKLTTLLIAVTAGVVVWYLTRPKRVLTPEATIAGIPQFHIPSSAESPMSAGIDFMLTGGAGFEGAPF